MLLKNVSKRTFDIEGKVIPPGKTYEFPKLDRIVQDLLNRRFFVLVIPEPTEEVKKIKIVEEVSTPRPNAQEFEPKIIEPEFKLEVPTKEEDVDKTELKINKKHNKKG